MKAKLKKFVSTVLYLTLVAIFYGVKYGIYDSIKMVNNNRFNINTKEKLLILIVQGYHGIEKGLTMPKRRLGFGQDALIRLMINITRYITTYNEKPKQLKHAVFVIRDYMHIHNNVNKFDLHPKIYSLYNSLDKIVEPMKIYDTSQIVKTSKKYWESTEANFVLFSNSRYSVRSFSSEPVNLNTIRKSIELAQNAPSSCNRQSTRIHIYSKHDEISQILELQGGARGFGHLADKLIIVTAEWCGYEGFRERNAPYIDGGIFSMNLMYALHYYNIASCALNCSFTIKSEKKIREITNIPRSEEFIIMLLVGNPMDNFAVNSSLRLETSDIVTYH